VTFSNLIEGVAHVLILGHIVVNGVSCPPPLPPPNPCLSQKCVCGISCYTSHFCKLPRFLWEKQFFHHFWMVWWCMKCQISWLVQCTFSKMCFPLFSLSIFYNGQWMVQKASNPKYIFWLWLCTHRLLAIEKDSESCYLRVFRLLVYALSQDKRYTEDVFINVHQ
jgi:hypothetical protein